LQYLARKRQPPYWTVHQLRDQDVPLDQVSRPALLAPYVHQIQDWLHVYGKCQMAASLLRPYYTALTNVVRHIDPLQLGSQYFGYIGGRVFGAAQRANAGAFQRTEEEQPASEEEADDRCQNHEDESSVHMMQEIIGGLDEHVRRIYQVEHERPRVADSISSALIALLEHGTIHCGQNHLNAARAAMLPLLDLSRFERRYVLRPPWE
jgi:DNA-binding TFAR19-related protein (PDSD5 family)